MADKVFLNAQRTAVVDRFGPGKKWQVDRDEAVKLGLLSGEEAKPQKRRNEAFDATKAKTAPTRKRNARRQGQNTGMNRDA